MKRFLFFLLFLLITCSTAFAAPAGRLTKPPLAEQWFGIYMDGERVGFYRQKISESGDGYRIEGDGSVRMRVMGFSKESSVRETYQVGKGLTLASFSVEQSVNGKHSLLSGRAADGGLRVKMDVDGKVTEKRITHKGDVYPGAALNIVPLMRDATAGKVHRLQIYDPEENAIKEVKVTMLGQESSPAGQPAIKMRNNLYPFVNNDVWVDSQASTLYESVRDGLVVTRAEAPKEIASFISGLALSKKDLIYDFSLVRVEPPIRDVRRLSGLSLEISGWDDALPLIQGAGQNMSRTAAGKISVRTGTLAAPSPEAGQPPGEALLKPAQKIESDNPEIAARAAAITSSAAGTAAKVAALSAWTSEWLADTIDDGGGAAESFAKRSGNCQTHARLYTAAARSAGIATRFVSGLVYQEGKGFLYHSWAESWVDGKWMTVDPTYAQAPADPTHIKLFEGHLPEDMAPMIAIIGRISIKVLEAKY